jgi:hypothetical protein
VSFEPDSKVSAESALQEKKENAEIMVTDAGIQIDRSGEHDQPLGPISVNFELDSKAITSSALQREIEGRSPTLTIRSVPRGMTTD